MIDLATSLLFTAVFCTLTWTASGSSIAIAAAILAGLYFHRLEPIALASLFSLAFALWLATRPKLPNWAKGMIHVGALLLTLTLFQHLAPGFHNRLVFDRVRFSSDAVPFTMYLNFDKTLAGLLICFFLIRPWEKRLSPIHWKIALMTASLLIVLMAALAPMSGYVRLDLKWPALAWLWAMNNFFFVCLAEEALFRGYIQGGLQKLVPERFNWAPVMIAALLFGAAHFRGGAGYIAFATLAGLFYGYSYLKTDRLTVPMLVHFSLNLTHFAFFTYPALAPP